MRCIENSPSLELRHGADHNIRQEDETTLESIQSLLANSQQGLAMDSVSHDRYLLFCLTGRRR